MFEISKGLTAEPSSKHDVMSAIQKQTEIQETMKENYERMFLMQGTI